MIDKRVAVDEPILMKRRTKNETEDSLCLVVTVGYDR